mgnify:CR=1 FL=1
MLFRSSNKGSDGFSNILYGDGHAAALSYQYATQDTVSGLTPTTGLTTVINNLATTDYNKYTNCIWSPYALANN